MVAEGQQGIFSVLDSVESSGTRIDILEYPELGGSNKWQIAEHVHTLNRAGVRLKQVRIMLTQSAVMAEAGALHFMKGNIDMENRIGGVTGFAKKVMSAVATDESLFKPTYRGTGEIFLEPSFGHFLLLRTEGAEVVVDKGMYYACEADMQVGIARNTGTARAFGGEGWYQTRITGNGVCVLASPVPQSEIVKYQLNGETLKVDGTFAILRKGNIEFTVEKSTKSVIGSLTSGEGLLQTFRGTGEVWLAPTEAIYGRLMRESLQQLARAQASSHNQ